MFRFTRRRLGKLLLMCHRLELFIEKDEPGQRGAAFDLWRFILRIKKPTPPHRPEKRAPRRVHVRVCARAGCPFANGTQQQPTNSEIASLLQRRPG